MSTTGSIRDECGESSLSKKHHSCYSRGGGCVRLSLVLHGEAAWILCELRKRGVVRSYADCVNQAILLIYREVTEQDLRAARLKTLQNGLGRDEDK
jgi:hypothetical protein